MKLGIYLLPRLTVGRKLVYELKEGRTAKLLVFIKHRSFPPPLLNAMSSFSQALTGYSSLEKTFKTSPFLQILT